jgi:hypothetical protein
MACILTYLRLEKLCLCYSDSDCWLHLLWNQNFENVLTICAETLFSMNSSYDRSVVWSCSGLAADCVKASTSRSRQADAPNVFICPRTTGAVKVAAQDAVYVWFKKKQLQWRMKRHVTVNEIIILQQQEMALGEFSAKIFTETRSGQKS